MKVKVSISLDEAMLLRIDKIAEKMGAKRSGIIQRMIDRSIEEWELFADGVPAEHHWMYMMAEDGVDPNDPDMTIKKGRKA